MGDDMSKKQDKIDKAIRIGCYVAGAYFVGTAIAGAIKRKREAAQVPDTEPTDEPETDEPETVEGIGVITPTGNEKTTIREAWKHRKDNCGYVIFKDIEEPNENQVWVIDSYDPSLREYCLYNWANTNKDKFVKGDKVCFTGFYF